MLSFHDTFMRMLLWLPCELLNIQIWISNNLHVNFYSLAERVILSLVCVVSVSGFGCAKIVARWKNWDWDGERSKGYPGICEQAFPWLLSLPFYPSSYLECDWPWCLNLILLEILMSVCPALKYLNFGYELNYIIILVWRIHVTNCRCGSISLL